MLAAVWANGALVTYTDRATWDAALGGAATTLEDFNGVAVDTLIPGSLTYNSIEFDPVGSFQQGARFDVAPFAFNPAPTTGIDGSPLLNMGGARAPGGMDIILPGSAFAFGIDTNNFDVNNDRAEILINGVQVGLTPPTRGQIGFVGVVATTPADYFNLIEIRALSGALYNSFDNLEFAPVVIPEPVSAILFAAFGLMALYGRPSGK